MRVDTTGSKKGQSIIELILAIGLASVFLPALLMGLVSSREGYAQQNQRLDATHLLREAEEAVRVVRENSWSQIANNGTYHPVISGNTWSLASNAESVSGFTRSIVISDVYRDASGSISSSGNIDPSTKKTVVTVSWSGPILSSVSSTAYLTRHLKNAAFIDTSEVNFNAGTLTNAAVTTTNGGEVVLGAGGYGNWCKPNLSIAAIDLPKSGIANALMAIEGKAFAGTGDNAAGVSFANISITDTNPPQASAVGTFDGYKTNSVFGESSYAYLGTDNNAREIVIIDLTQIVGGKYEEIGYFNAPGNGNGNSVFVLGNIGFMTDGNKLYTFDLSSKSGSRSQLGVTTLAGEGEKVFVVGNYAYVAIDSTSTQLQIVEVSPDGKVLTVVGQASVNGGDGKDVYVNSSATRAYLVTSASAAQREFFIVDVSTKSGSRPTIGSFEASGMNPKGVTLVTGNKAITVGTGGEEYQVIDLNNETIPSRCGGLNIDSGVNGMSSVSETDGDAYSYIITGDVSSEFNMIEGGPGGQYAMSGTYESATYAYPSTSSPQQISLNRFIANIAKPAGTDIKLQLATADPVSGSCSGAAFTYVGPDGTGSTYYTPGNDTAISAAFPISTTGSLKNPSSCIRYKVSLSTTDRNATPVFYDMTVNYSQ